MESLREQIRQELNTYQQQVADKLEELLSQGLMSHHEYERIVIDAKATGQAIIDGLDTNPNIPQDLVESYVYSLFDRYKREVEDKIREVEHKSEQQVKIQSLLKNITTNNLNLFVDFLTPFKFINQKKNVEL
ncbi:MAG: hypothetical protein RLZZ338_1435 [Cyanobacteriota bacterium]|jgi:hypothetical protein